MYSESPKIAPNFFSNTNKISSSNISLVEYGYIPFYEVIYPNSKKKSYIFLSKHVISSKQFNIPKFAFEKLNCCKGITFECSPYTDTAKIHSNAIQLANELIKKRYKELKVLLQDIKNDISLNSKPTKKLTLHFEKMYNLSQKMMKLRKSMQGNQDYMVISISHVAFGLIYPENCLFIENEFLNFAKSNNKLIKALDSDILVEKDSIKPLTLKAAKTAINIIESLVQPELFEFHKSIEEEMTEEYIKGDFSGTTRRSKFNKFFTNVIKRNRKWVEKIYNNPNFFYVIGADHFPNEYGLKRLLENKGCTIKNLGLKS